MNNKIKLLWEFLKGNRIFYTGALISVVLSTIFSLLSPMVIKVTIDSIIGNTELKVPEWVGAIIRDIGGRDVIVRNLWICAIVIVILTVFNGIFAFARGKWSAKASEGIAKNIRDKLYEKFHSMPYDYHVRTETGDLIQRSTSDVETVRHFLAVQLVEVGRAIFLIVFVVSLMITLDKLMTLVAMSVIPVIFIFALVFFIRVKNKFKMLDESEGSMSTVLQENLTGVRVVKAFGRQAHEFYKFDQKNNEFRKLEYKLLRTLAWFWSTSDFLCLIQLVLVTVLGVYWGAEGRISLGTLVAFSTYEGMLLWPVRQMGRILSDMGKMMVSLGRIKEVLDQEEEAMDEYKDKPDLAGDIVFRDVCFEYEEGKPVLDTVSFRIKQGQTVAVLGPTGSGKTSLVNLLLRLYDYKSGSISINGVELKDISKKWLRTNIGIVSQEPFLFSRTVRDNIAIARDGAENSIIEEAAKTAAVHGVIQEFEKGYDTVIGERGVTLSGGQKQRVAMARCLIRNCPILVFDDSLSAVDTETDAQIRKRLKEKNKNTTTFIISHRINTLMEADLILVLNEGRLEQSGSHIELVEKSGLYRKIWAIQSSSL